MPIPHTRDELINQLEASFEKLLPILTQLKPADGRLICVDDWTVKGLLSVRAWWTEQTVIWIELGQRGESFELPAAGYRWTETPQLNAEIIRRSQRESVRRIVARIEIAYMRTREKIDTLTDRELLHVGTFEWAGKWPIARWISINTVRQYTTARTHLRRAIGTARS